MGGEAEETGLRGRIRIRSSYWGYKLTREFFVNVNVKVNDGWWRMEDRRWDMGKIKDPVGREGRP